MNKIFVCTVLCLTLQTRAAFGIAPGLMDISPPDVDCVEDEPTDKSACTNVCGTIPYTVTTQQSGNGTACTNPEYQCQAGDGDCPSPCDASTLQPNAVSLGTCNNNLAANGQCQQQSKPGFACGATTCPEPGGTTVYGACLDVNECDSNQDNCDVNAACTNTIGSFDCSCDDGWEGNGNTCTKVKTDTVGCDGFWRLYPTEYGKPETRKKMRMCTISPSTQAVWTDCSSAYLQHDSVCHSDV